MNKNIMLLIMVFCMAPSMIFAGTSYYVDPSAASDGTGTYASPWKNIYTIKAHPFKTGDDLYFKVGTTFVVPAGQCFDITWNGTSGDWVNIGAYYGNGLFGLNGGVRPIIDGNSNTAPADGSYNGLITKRNYSTQADAYVEIKDLKIQYSGHSGIVLSLLKNVKVTNCYTYRGRWSGGITIAKVDTATIDGNIVEYSRISGTGASIEITGLGDLTTCKNITVSNNTVSKGFEGIGVYNGASYVRITGNIVYDNASYNIYSDSSQYLKIDNNIVYTSAQSLWSPRQGITIDSEDWHNYCFTGHIDIHNNYLANVEAGITLATNRTVCDITYTNIYNNIIADATIYNFSFWDMDAGWNNNKIYNNISYTSNNSKMKHSKEYSPIGITWGVNIFDDAVSGNAAKNASIGVVLAKTTGWNSLPAGGVNASYFEFTSGGRAMVNSVFGTTTEITIPTTEGLRIN